MSDICPCNCMLWNGPPCIMFCCIWFCICSTPLARLARFVDVMFVISELLLDVTAAGACCEPSKCESLCVAAATWLLVCVTNDCVEAAAGVLELAGMGLRTDVMPPGADGAGTEPGRELLTPDCSDGLAILGMGGADEQAPAVADDDDDVTAA